MTADRKVQRANPIGEFQRRHQVCVLDGGLATTLEDRGCNLNGALWSARLLLDQPDAIRSVHRAFLDAGADCITSASYQASLPGFAARGIDEREGANLLRRSVALAIEARDAFWAVPGNRRQRMWPLVAASVGPYGAFLADGSEYLGGYDLDADGLRAFHEMRWRVLSETEADLLAVETLPDARETDVLLGLLDATPGRWAWFSFSCRDERHLHDGTALRDVVRRCNTVRGVAAVGINCTDPSLVSALVGEARAETDLPVIVYPNSGEQYDAGTRSWAPGTSFDWMAGVREWMALGVAGIGGCCRVGPAEVRAIRQAVVGTGRGTGV